MKNPSVVILFLCITFSLSGIFTSCNHPAVTYFEKEIDSISRKYVPDKREGICEVEVKKKGSEIVLKGFTSLPALKEALVKFLKEKVNGFIDSLIILPDTSIIKEPWAIVDISVCNIRSTPGHDAEMVSQALMGTPVKVLRYNGGWYLIQTPDSYVGYVDDDAITTMNTDSFEKWKSSSRIIWLAKTGDIYSVKNNNRIVSDIVAGNILEISGENSKYYTVTFPDGREGLLNKKNCEKFEKWVQKTRPEVNNLVATAEEFMGTPYLWGGTSSKGMDCSGFTKTVYFLNGLILARDVSLQFMHGMKIESGKTTDSLKIGDLLFFGSKRDGKPRPTHVGMYIGDTRFIHSSGMVKINSLDSTKTDFSRFRRDSFLGVRRIIGEPSSRGILLVKDHSWYK